MSCAPNNCCCFDQIQPNNSWFGDFFCIFTHPSFFKAFVLMEEILQSEEYVTHIPTQAGQFGNFSTFEKLDILDDHFFVLKSPTGVPSIPWSGDGLTADLTPEGTIPEETFKRLGWRNTRAWCYWYWMVEHCWRWFSIECVYIFRCFVLLMKESG